MKWLEKWCELSRGRGEASGTVPGNVIDACGVEWMFVDQVNSRIKEDERCGR